MSEHDLDLVFLLEELVEEQGSRLGTHPPANDLLSQDCVYEVRICQRHRIDVDELEFARILAAFLISQQLSYDFKSRCCLTSAWHSRNVERTAGSLVLHALHDIVRDRLLLLISTRQLRGNRIQLELAACLVVLVHKLRLVLFVVAVGHEDLAHVIILLNLSIVLLLDGRR